MILASASTARRAMLVTAGLDVLGVAADVDEAALKTKARKIGLGMRETAVMLAEAKAKKVSFDHPGTLVLGADQMLDCDGRWLDKPENRTQAVEQLKILRGKTHHLISAAVVVRDGETLWQHVEAAALTMWAFDDRFLQTYLDACGAAVFGSVGVYHLEGLGVQLFKRIEGDYFSILGLPLVAVMAFLRQQAENDGKTKGTSP